MDSSQTAAEPMYVIWSNDAGAWWGPGGHGYRGADIWAAGRFTREQALQNCSMRTWPSGVRKMPPEVMIPAPENGGLAFTTEELRDLPRMVSAMVDHTTLEAADERDRERRTCGWCGSGGEPGRGSCHCTFRCGYGGCCSSASPALAVFGHLTSRER